MIYSSFRKRFIIYEHQEQLLTILTEAKDTSYSKIYLENCITEIINRTKLNEDQIRDLSKEYVRLIYTFLGETVLNDLHQLYGGEEEFISILTVDFTMKIISDELKVHHEQVEQNLETGQPSPRQLNIEVKT